MTKNADKVRPIHPETDKDDSGRDHYENVADEIMASTGKDMSKAAIFISILAVVLLVVFFFGLNQNITGLSKEVEGLQGLDAKVQKLDAGVAEVNERIDRMPRDMREMMLASDLREMIQRIGEVSTHVDKEQAGKLSEAMQLLQEIETNLSK